MKNNKIEIEEALKNIENILNSSRRYTDIFLVKDNILKEVNNIKNLIKNGN